MLAKAFWKVRGHAYKLHQALGQGWVSGCHQEHTVMVSPDDCIKQALTSTANGGKRRKLPMFEFRLGFVVSRDPLTNVYSARNINTNKQR